MSPLSCTNLICIFCEVNMLIHYWAKVLDIVTVLINTPLLPVYFRISCSSFHFYLYMFKLPFFLNITTKEVTETMLSQQVAASFFMTAHPSCCFECLSFLVLFSVFLVSQSYSCYFSREYEIECEDILASGKTAAYWLCWTWNQTGAEHWYISDVTFLRCKGFAYILVNVKQTRGTSFIPRIWNRNKTCSYNE